MDKYLCEICTCTHPGHVLLIIFAVLSSSALCNLSMFWCFCSTWTQVVFSATSEGKTKAGVLLGHQHVSWRNVSVSRSHYINLRQDEHLRWLWRIPPHHPPCVVVETRIDCWVPCTVDRHSLYCMEAYPFCRKTRRCIRRCCKMLLSLYHFH
jgi:hypothetical protein